MHCLKIASSLPTPADVGGKASSLARLASRFAVPSFVILTSDPSVQDGVDRALLVEIERQLGVGPFAVRSSANVEDHADQSYAGMFSTVLGVKLNDLPSAVATVMSSAASERVAAYRQAIGRQSGLIHMSVVVQRLVSSDRSGVCLTRRSAVSDELLIEAVLGLGEYLVSGEVDPDQYIVARGDLALLATKVGYQGWALCQSGGSVSRERVAPSARTAPKLLANEVREVAELALEVEREFGESPYDIEWAFEEDNLYLLQARPYVGARMLPPGHPEA